MEVPALENGTGFSIRACSSSWWESLESVVGWTDYMLGTSSALCFGDRGPGGKSGRSCGQGMQVFREVMLPQYMATEIEELETRRQSMLLSLTGQFTVVLFRFLTGHWGSAVIGLVVFAVGNRARCSLQNTSLTSFVILGFGTGLLDSVDLLHNIVSHGTGFFVFPLEQNLLQDLWAIALALAPVAEVGGARLAWDSFLQPELLLRAPRASALQCHPGYGPQLGPWGQMGLGQVVSPYAMQQSGWQWQGPPQPQDGWHQGGGYKQNGGWYNPSHGASSSSHGAPGQSSSWSSAAYRAIFGGTRQEAARVDEGDDFDDASSVSSSMYSATRPRASALRRRPYSTGSDSVHGRPNLGPLSSTDRLTEEPHRDSLSEDEHDGGTPQCAGCGEGVPASEARNLCGVGNFADTVYCQPCWQAWSASSH